MYALASGVRYRSTDPGSNVTATGTFSPVSPRIVEMVCTSSDVLDNGAVADGSSTGLGVWVAESKPILAFTCFILLRIFCRGSLWSGNDTSCRILSQLIDRICYMTASWISLLCSWDPGGDCIWLRLLYSSKEIFRVPEFSLTLVLSWAGGASDTTSDSDLSGTGGSPKWMSSISCHRGHVVLKWWGHTPREQTSRPQLMVDSSQVWETWPSS